MLRRLSSIAFAFLLTIALATPSLAATKKQTPKKSPTTTKAAPKKEVPEAFPATDDGTPPTITAASAILIDAQSGRALFEFNADDARPVASTQKLLTGLIIAEEGGLDEPVRVAASDTDAEPSKLYIKPGEIYERGKLLQILLVKSMNDVARCLARDNAGSVEAFAEKMNAKAAQLGMRNSRFVNPNGLPAPGQYSTARDLAKVAMAAYRNRTVRSIVCQRSTTWRYNDGRVRTFESTNKVLRNWPLCNGMKTGYTDAAGHCLISSASFGGRDVISVILGDKQVWTDSHRMLAWGLAF
jgi:D-alanyl-D-alanine carboxypeptidase (penicillin-binding protein 5/6)